MSTEEPQQNSATRLINAFVYESADAFNTAFGEYMDGGHDSDESPVAHEMAQCLGRCRSRTTFLEMQAKVTMAWMKAPHFVERRNTDGVSGILALAATQSSVVDALLLSYTATENRAALFHDAAGRNVFHYAARVRHPDHLLNDAGIRQYVEMWSKRGGFDVNCCAGQEGNGETPLHWCVQHNNAPLARHLIACGANPDLENASGETPLMHAFTIGRGNDVVKELVLAGCAIDTLLDQQRHTLQYKVEDGSASTGERSVRAQLHRTLQNAKILRSREVARRTYANYVKDTSRNSIPNNNDFVSNTAATNAEHPLLTNLTWKKLVPRCDAPPCEGEPTNPFELARYRLDKIEKLQRGLMLDEMARKDTLLAEEPSELEENIMPDDLRDSCSKLYDRLIKSIQLESVADREEDTPRSTINRVDWFQNDHSLIFVRLQIPASNGSLSPPAVALELMPNPRAKHRDDYPYQDFGGAVVTFDWDRYAQYVQAYSNSVKNPYRYMDIIAEHNNNVTLENGKYLQWRKIDDDDGWDVSVHVVPEFLEDKIEQIPHSELVAEAYQDHLEDMVNVADEVTRPKLAQYAEEAKALAALKTQRIVEVNVSPVIHILIDLTNTAMRKTVEGNLAAEKLETAKQLDETYNPSSEEQ